MGRKPLKGFAVAALAAVLAGAPTPAANATDGDWHPIAGDASPVPSQFAMSAFDLGRNLLYVWDFNSPDRIWTLNPSSPVWSSIVPAGTAPPVFAGRMILDTAYDRLVLLDCEGAEPVIYTVNLSGAPMWHTDTPEDGPSARIREAAVYDPMGQRMIVYGGVDNSVAQYDTWALYLAADGMKWDKLYSFGPVGFREGPQAIFDPIGNRLIVHGGIDRTNGSAPPFSDVWALALGAIPEWTQLAGSGSGPARWLGAAAYDGPRHRMLVYGGLSANGGESDTWAFDLDDSTWTQIPAGAAPGPRSEVSGLIDSQGRFNIFGGRLEGGEEQNDLWALDPSPGSMWNLVHADPDRVDGRKDAVFAYDPLRHRAIVTGGTDVNGVDDRTWVMDPGTQYFRKLATTNGLGAVPARSGASGVWDPVRDRLLVFGGLGGMASRDVVALDGATSVWNVVAVPLTPQPSPRMYAPGAYDAARDRVLYFGGYPLANAHNQVWALSLAGSASWSLLAPVGTVPPQRYGHTFTADPDHDRMFSFGGGETTPTNDLYVLSLAGAGTWAKLSGPGTPPPARWFHSAIFDPVHDRLIVWGGKDASGQFLDDTWEYRLDGGGGWSLLPHTVRPPAAAAAGIYDAALHRMVIFGGQTAAGLACETWWMELAGQTTAVPGGGATVAFALEGATPNPSPRAPKISFSLPDASPAKLELIDLAGRRVRAADVGSLGAGRHVVDFGGAGAIAPGLYFARLTRAGEAKTSRVCVVR